MTRSVLFGAGFGLVNAAVILGLPWGLPCWLIGVPLMVGPVDCWMDERARSKRRARRPGYINHGR